MQKWVVISARPLNDEDSTVRYTAATRLLGNGEFAAVAVSHLLAEDEDRVQVLRDLSVMGTRIHIDQVPPELMRACRDSSPRVRAAAISAIAAVAPGFPSTIDSVANALQDENMVVRHTAAVHLGESSDPRAKAAVPELIAAVRYEPRDYFGFQRRRMAITLLGKHKSAAAVPALIAALNDEKLVSPACLALGKIGPSASAAVPALGKLAETQGHIAHQAIWALKAIQDEGVKPNGRQ